MSSPLDYLRDGAEIYRRSFAIIRAEADLARFSGAAERVVVRMIHACGMTDLPRDVELSPDFADAGAKRRSRAGAPILCDSKMVANGITRARLPAGNEVVCTLDDPRVAGARRGDSATPARPPPWNCGASGWPARSWWSATRRRPCSACSNCSTTARRARRR